MYHIEYLRDETDCETCGSSYASGYKIYFEGECVVDKTPYAHCYSGADYYEDSPHKDILEHMGVLISEEIYDA